MPRTPEQAYAWARDEARAARVRRNWAGMCEAAVNWAFDYQAFPTALAAGSASGPLRDDYANAPVGANIYWSGVWVDGVECGHIATVYAQDADPYVFMASSAVTDNWGGNLGTIRLSDYQKRFGHKLRGWSLRHGSETAIYPEAQPPQEETNMSFSFVKDAQSATIFVCSLDTGRRVGIQSIYHLGLLDRYQKNKANDPMLVAELDIVRAYLSQLNDPDSTGTVLAAIQKIAINPADVKAAVKAAVGEGVNLTAEVDPADLDAAAERFAKLLGIRIAGGTLK